MGRRGSKKLPGLLISTVVLFALPRISTESMQSRVGAENVSVRVRVPQVISPVCNLPAQSRLFSSIHFVFHCATCILGPPHIGGTDVAVSTAGSFGAKIVKTLAKKLRMFKKNPGEGSGGMYPVDSPSEGTLPSGSLPCTSGSQHAHSPSGQQRVLSPSPHSGGGV